MTRVLLLSMSLGPGGAEDQALRLAIGLRGRGWEPAVASLLPLSGDGRERELAAAGVPAFSLGMRPAKADPRAFTRLAAIMDRFRPQVLHSHMFHANCLARAVRLVCPAPVVISSLHSAAEAPRSSTAGGSVRRRDWTYRLTDCLADSVVAVSRAAAERHASSGAVRRAKLRVIPNAVDTALFRPDAERRTGTRRELGLDSQFVWLAAGRLIWKKHYPTMLQAMALAQTAGSSVLLIAGEGPEETELKQLAAGLGVNARFLGRAGDMPALMNAADALVLSSLVEGLPMVLLEAAASGLPAVATNVGGVAEIVADGETGFVVPSADAAALGNAMTRLASLAPGAREAMSTAARAAAARFDTGVIVSLWDALYRELLENSPWT